jgi:UDP-glucose:(heptosyl)LPS alpha-1,3-glucosyltransferase
MKVALVILHANPARGGAERYTVDLASTLGKRGHDVALISCESLKPRGFTRTGRYKRFLRAVQAHLKAARYDVVHAMLPIPECDLYHPHAGVAAEAADKWNAISSTRGDGRWRGSSESYSRIRTGPSCFACRIT